MNKGKFDLHIDKSRSDISDGRVTNQDDFSSFIIKDCFRRSDLRRGGQMAIDIILIEVIRAAQMGDRSSMLTLINQFEPLICKYARKLNIERDDAKQELLLAFIKLIIGLKISTFQNASNGAIVAYIAKAVYFSYIAISKKHKKIFDKISTEEVRTAWGTDHYSLDCYANVYISEIETVLTEKEFQVFFLHCIWDKPVSEIAQKLGMSRKSINKIKLKAIQKLKGFYRED